MSNLFRARILTLRKSQWGESNVILHGVSSQGKYCSLLARGALKSKRRFAGGVLDPLQFIEIVAKVSPKSDALMTLEEAQLIDDFPGLRTQYEKLEVAFWVASSLQSLLTEDEEQNRILFDLMGNGLRALEAQESYDSFKLQFALKALQTQGVLQVEAWMLPYLQRNLKEGSAAHFDENDPYLAEHLDWVEHQLKVYISRAEL